METKAPLLPIHFSTLAVKVLAGTGDRKCHHVPPSLLSFFLCVWVRKHISESDRIKSKCRQEMQKTPRWVWHWWQDMFIYTFFLVLFLGNWRLHRPSEGQKLWHTGAFWEKRAECRSHSCGHGCNKGNADSFVFVLTRGHSGGALWVGPQAHYVVYHSHY